MLRAKYLVLLLLPFFMGCKKDRDNSQVPRVPTDITINLNLPQYNPLVNPGSWVYVAGGSRGIIVYRLSVEDFTAFDRHCTYNITEGCRINVQDGTIAKDEDCCNSELEFISGTRVSGPAQQVLQGFNTQFNPNANFLRIYN